MVCFLFLEKPDVLFDGHFVLIYFHCFIKIEFTCHKSDGFLCVNFCFLTSAVFEMKMTLIVCVISQSKFIISVYKFTKGNAKGSFDRYCPDCTIYLHYL